jgi:hypothetical protein
MKIEFEGTYSNICSQMVEFLKGSAYVVTTVAEQVAVEADRGPVERVAALEPDNGNEVVDFDALPKKRGRPKKVEPTEAPATEADVKAAMEDDEILNTPREDPDPLEDLQGDPDYVEASLDAVTLHRLKEETLKKLRSLYISGKGPFVRQLLAKHGHGALVFPEVEAKHFPAIKADMDRGALN